MVVLHDRGHRDAHAPDHGINAATSCGRTPAGDPHSIQILFRGLTMSDTTLQSETHPVTPPATPAPVGLSGAHARLWAALTRLPGATAAELADAARIGRSTAGKTLATLETNGMTHRQPGGFDGNRRLPDHWYAAATPADGPTTPDRGTATTPHAGPQPPVAAGSGPATTDGAEALATGHEPPVGPEPDAGQEPAETATEPRHDETSNRQPDEPEADADEGPVGTPASAAVTPAEAPVSAAATPSSGRQRRAPGALRHRVLTFLQDRPGEEWGPTGLSRQLEASSGAISNALDRLVTLGLAQRTSEKPRRFTAVTPEEPTPQS
jgi:DNA-binding MarR family transcriptional regulator